MPKRLLLHNLSIQYPSSSASLYDFDQNGIFFAHPGDILITRSKFSEAYLSFLMSCGLLREGTIFMSPQKTPEPNAEGIFMDAHFREQIRNQMGNESYTLDSFMYSRLEAQFAAALGVTAISGNGQYENFATKSTFRALAKEVGIPIPRGFGDQWGILDTAIRAGILFLTGFNEVIIKDDWGVTGIGSMRIRRNEFHDALLLLDKKPKKTVVVEGWYGKSTQSPSIQFYIDENGETECVSKHVQHFHENKLRYRGCSSEQWIDTSIRAQLLEEGTRFSEHLAAEGYRGHVGLNAIVPRQGKLLWVELNPRRVMSSYPFQICQRLYGERSAHVHYTSLRIQKRRWIGKRIEDILSEISTLLYSKDTQQGVIPFDHGLLREEGQLTLAAFSFQKDDPAIMLTYAENL